MADEFTTQPLQQPAQPVYGGTPPPPGPTVPGASGKAITALVLGILSLICCGFLTGIPAIFVGKGEMNAIKEGRSSIAGESVAKIGYVLGIIGTVLTCLAALAYAALFAFGFGAGLLEELKKGSALLGH